jgi:hypothetical protein
MGNYSANSEGEVPTSAVTIIIAKVALQVWREELGMKTSGN